MRASLSASPCSSFVHMKYHKSKTGASHIAGGVYYVSMGLSPFMGAVVVRCTLPWRNVEEGEQLQHKCTRSVALLVFCHLLTRTSLNPSLVPLLQDRLGGRGYLSILCSVLTVPVFVILAFVGPELSPYVPVLGLGVTYSIMAAVLWPSIPLIVTPSTVGARF